MAQGGRNASVAQSGGSARSGPANIRFAASRHIAPSFHVGPRTYAAHGVVVHPLQGLAIQAAPQSPGAPAGTGQVASGVAALLQNSRHPFTVNGREPG